MRCKTCDQPADGSIRIADKRDEYHEFGFCEAHALKGIEDLLIRHAQIDARNAFGSGGSISYEIVAEVDGEDIELHRTWSSIYAGIPGRIAGTHLEPEVAKGAASAAREVLDYHFVPFEDGYDKHR